MPPHVPRNRQSRSHEIFSEPRIVLAIDYGTTFTGLAWMQTDGEGPPEFSDLNLFVDWPGKNEVKVPSEVSYSLTTGEAHNRDYRQWGYSIDGKSKVLRWTKLELVKDHSPLEELKTLGELIDGLAAFNNLYAESLETAEVPRHLSKTTKDIIEFYLSHVAREWITFVKGEAKHVLDRVPVDIVVTHPAMWPDYARNSLLKAVYGAFNKVNIPTRRNVHIISEPAACALYVIQDVIRNSSRSLQVGDCFTLCDAGGGTIDLVSYYLDSIDPLRLIRIGNESGTSIGATTVDRAFLRWLDTKLENLDVDPGEYGKGGHYVLNPRVNLLLSRFEAFKRNFTGSESYDLTLPRQVIITSTEDDGETRQLHISSEKMKEMFKESIDGVKDLITKQVTQVEEAIQHGRRCRVSSIFLAGGFAESGYLYEEVRKTARSYGIIHVQRADDCWSSVVKGAVLKGMAIGSELPPKVATCPRRYGLSLNRDGQPTSKQGCWTIDPLDKNAFSPYSLIWLSERGDVIFPGSQIKKMIKLCFETQELGQATKITFLANNSDIIPRRMEDLMTGGGSLIEDLTVRLDRLKPTDYTTLPVLDARGKKKPSYVLSVEVELTVKHAVTIDVKHRDRVIATHTTASL